MSTDRLSEAGKGKNKPIVEGAAAPAGLPPLPGLGLASTKVGDAGLAHLKSLHGLQRLDLSNTQVTDAGLQALHGLTGLRLVELRGSKATAAGVEALCKAIPGVRIVDR